MHKNKSVDVHNFAMIPRADIPRSSFKIEYAHKTTFDAGYLIPIYLDEVLPGDTFKLKMTAFARMSTPIFPIMDNLHLDSFFFFVPNRLLWDNWVRFMGERDNPASSISYTVPQTNTTAVQGAAQCSIYDYFGLPIDGQIPGPVPAGSLSVNALPFRAYNTIYNEWFRDQNLINSVPESKTDGPDLTAWTLLRRGKRHDYFTSALPFVQKGTAVSIPLGTTAPVVPVSPFYPRFEKPGGTTLGYMSSAPTSAVSTQGAGDPSIMYWDDPALEVNLASATSATINQLRQSFQIQRLLERDARGGTRYTEILRSHFGVVSPDARLQRPEYLGGGSSQIQVTPIAQQSGTGASGTTTALGTVGAQATSLANRHGFTQSFTEHGYILGLVNVRADLSYQNGLRKLWSRSTRYDFYFPVFAHLGEQAILNKEIFQSGVSATDNAVFGYQERWAEYRYNPSLITGMFRSPANGTMDAWHLAQNFTVTPTLNETFIQEDPPMSRILAAGLLAGNQQFIFDSFFEVQVARAMPLFSVPGLVDHF